MIGLIPDSFALSGHYKGLEWSDQEQKYVDNSDLGILVEVDVSSAFVSVGLQGELTTFVSLS